MGEWLAVHSAGRSEETIETYEGYCSATLIPFFGSLASITTLASRDYARARLRKVSATTVRKELSALRQFVEWAHEAGYLPEPVEVPGLPKRATGTASDRVQVRVVLTQKQLEAFIAKVPEQTPRGYPARAFVVVSIETGLRRATLWRLEAPRHYHVGSDLLRLTDDIDKARWGRDLPLSDRAREALDSVCPREGLVFGRGDLRYWLRQASTGIGLPPHLEGRVSYHDLRHAFLTSLAESGATLAGLQYLAGHKHASTSARYIHPAEDAARAALEARNGTPIGTPTKEKGRQRNGRRRKAQ